MRELLMGLVLAGAAVGCGAQSGAAMSAGPDGAVMSAGPDGAAMSAGPDGGAGMLSAAVDGGTPSYYPLGPGRAWTYQVTTATGRVSQHQTTVEVAELSPSTHQMSFRMRYELPDAVKLEWDQQVGTSVVRYEEHQIDSSGNTTAGKTYSPSEVVLDESPEHLVAGAAWTENYMQTKTPSKTGKTTAETAQWTVEAVGEMVTVPAGTFLCMRIHRLHTSSKSPVPETTWYAAGVGKVKEMGAGPNNDEMLELSSMP